MQTAEEAIDLAGAIGLADAAKLLRGRGGKTANVETVRRWANPKKGCYPAGKDGPQLLLRTVRYNGELVTLPEWVREFEAARVRLGMRQAPPAELPRTDRKRKAGHKRAVEALRKRGLEAE